MSADNNSEVLSKIKFREIKHRFDVVSESAWGIFNNAEDAAVLKVHFKSNVNGGIEVTKLEVQHLSSFFKGALGLEGE